MPSIEQRLEWLQLETNLWANGGWRTKDEILREGKAIRAKELKLCLECGKRLDWYCRYKKCRKCRAIDFKN